MTTNQGGRQNGEASTLRSSRAAYSDTAQTHDDGTESGGTWIGAFERVMGDHSGNYGGAKQRSKHEQGTTEQHSMVSEANHEVERKSTISASGSETSQGLRTPPLSDTQQTTPLQKPVSRFLASPRGSDIGSPTISVKPEIIDFGMTNVGARKSQMFTVHNHSHLAAQIQLRYVSKVVSMNRDEITIPPNDSVDVRLDFFPRRVNEQYRKQITVANLTNRADDKILEVRSVNVDGQRIGFHSLFYRILTPTGSNFIDFGDVSIGCTRLRTFAIENVSNAALSLELSAANTEDLALYVKAEASHSSATASRRSSVTKYSLDDGTASTPSEPDILTRLATSKSKRAAHLKERFLESMSYDVPASLRNENKTWRIAQKQSHVPKSGSAQGRPGTQQKAVEKGGRSEKEQIKKPHINMIAALKKGGKGRLTQKYGKSITFKDRSLLSEFEYLDLATGPPVAGKRIPSKSRKYHLLDAQEVGKSAGTVRRRVGDNGATHVSTLTASPSRRLPGALADEIRSNGSGKRSESETRRPLPALTGKRKAGPLLHDAIDVSELSLEELLAAAEGQTSCLSNVFLSNARAEEQLVRTEMNLQRELRSAINEGRLLPVDVLNLDAREERQILAIYTPNGSMRPHIQGNARKQDTRIFFRLVDFSTQSLGPVKADLTDMFKTDKEELPVRDLIVKSNLCRSLMELSQPHINFGHVQKGETKTRKIVIQNRSELALRYCIRKSGSIASGDIKLKSSDRYGIVPGHAKREVEFIFCPSLTGTFQERLTVENVADRDCDETILIKANVTRVSNFSVEPRKLYFGAGEDGEGALAVGQLAEMAQSFVLSNLSAKTRIFAIHIAKDDLKFGAYHAEVLLTTSSQDEGRKTTLTKEEEEEIEHLSQKLKIANRKGQTEKIQKYQERLTELGITTTGMGTSDSPPADVGVANQTASSQASASSNGTVDMTFPVLQTASIHLAAQQNKRIVVRLRPLAVAKPDAEHHYHRDAIEVQLPIQVHESKNVDEVQTVDIRTRIRSVTGRGPQESEAHDGAIVAIPNAEEPLALLSSQRASSRTMTAAPSPTEEAHKVLL
jgi:hypothetical protein